MDNTDLLKRAAHYRYLAAHITDGQTREGLFELAKKYEALAREVERGAAQHSADTAD